MGVKNPDGSWTSSKGKRYGPDDLISDPADSQENAADLSKGLDPNITSALDDPNGPQGGFFSGTRLRGDTPGAEVDTSLANQQRDSMAGVLAQLQQQAATGNGSWEEALRDATTRSQSTAQAVGQSDASTGYGSSLDNIGNARAGASARAEGQGNILRAQSQEDAQGQLGTLLGAKGSQDIDQSQAVANARAGVRATNLTLKQKATKNMGDYASGLGQGITAALSDGGPVPGKAKVPGNDSANDTVPTMLSPGEVVLPRTIAHDPDAAAEFVRTLNASKQRSSGGVQHMAEGGDTGVYATERNKTWKPGDTDPTGPHPGSFDMFGAYGDTQAPSVENGGVLDDSQFIQTRNAGNQLATMLGERSRGGGPGAVIAKQQATNANDDAIMAAIGGGRGSGAAAGASQMAQAGAGEAATTRAKEQSAGTAALGHRLTTARGQELSLAQAQQQALWRNTLTNLGIGVEQQAAMKGLFSGAGQAATAFSGAGGPEYSGAYQSDYAGDRGGPADLTGGGGGHDADMAFGGVVSFADGGEVESEGMHEQRMRARKSGAEWAQKDVAVSRPVGERELRKQREWDEEGAGTYRVKPKKAADDSDTTFAKALRTAGEYAKRAASSVQGLAEGGPVYQGYDPAMFAAAPPAAAPPADPSLWGYQSSGSVAPGQLPPQLAAIAREPQVASDRYAPPAGTTAGAIPQTPSELGISAVAAKPPTTARADAEKAQNDRAAAQAAGIKPGLGGGVPGGGMAPGAPPAIAAKPSGGGFAIPKPADRSGLDSANEATITAAAGLEAQKAHAEATGIAERQRVANMYALQEKDVHDRAKMFTDDAFGRLRAANDEMNKIDASIDPGRYWASRTTGQKILGIIGLALGAAGTGPDGINRAAQMMNQAIDRDIDAQKAEYEQRLKRGEKKVAAAQSHYALARQAGLDEVAASHAAKAAGLENAANQTEQAIASINEPLAKLKGQALVTAARGGAADKTDAAKQRTFENRIQLGQFALAQEVAGRKAGGLSEGERKSVGDVTAAAKDALGLINSIEGTLARTQSPIPGKTTINQNIGADSAQLDTDAAQLVVKMKDINKLGQLGPADSKLLEEAIGDPKAIFTLESTKRAKLDRIKQIIRDSVANERSARGLQ